MNHRFISCFAAAAVEIAATPERARSVGAAGPTFDTLDPDHDGVPPGSEIAAARGTPGATTPNKECVISAPELQDRAVRGRVRECQNASRSAHRAMTIDASGDGVLHGLEVADASPALRRPDLNQNGAISRDGLRRLRLTRVG